MNKSESKYFNTALRMDEALLALLEEKDLDYPFALCAGPEPRGRELL